MKKVLILLIAALLIVRCSISSQSENNLAIAKAMFDAFNQHDWQKMASFYSEEALFLDPAFGQDYVTKNRSEIVTKYTEMEKMFPNIHDQVTGTYASDDKVIVEFISTGMVSDSIHFNLPIVSILTIKNGLIIRDATYYDLENP